MSLLTHIVRRVFVLLGLLTVFGLPAWAADVSTAYVDASGAAQTPRLATQLAGSGPLVAITILDNGGPNNGWYVADCAGTITMDGIVISGTVNLILADGCQLNVTNGIHVLAGNSLTIWAQTAGTGSLTATGNGSGTNSGGAGIGGGSTQGAGAITIHGGHITATGDGGGAGIGGGNGGGAGGTITIDGGTVNATGNNGGAGIGGGGGGASGAIAITGHATVSAQGGTYGGAGIGSGEGGAVNSITIGGGVNLLNVQGGSCSTMPPSSAAPIGRGCDVNPLNPNPVVMYLVSASAGAHGAIAPAGNFAVSAGDIANVAIDFAIVPDAGYEIDKVVAGTVDVTASLVPVGGVQTYQLRSAGYGNDPIVATFRPAGLPPTPTAATAVPTLGEWALVLLALGLAGMAGLHRKRGA